MQKLDPEHHIIITKEVLNTILGMYSLSDFTYSIIEDGIANTSCFIESLGKKYVVRVYASENKNNERILLEINFQDYLREHGIPIPVTYKNTAGKELTLVEVGGTAWQVILMEFIEGESNTEHPSAALVAELATLHARMHILGVQYAEKIGIPNWRLSELRDSVSMKIENIPKEDTEALAFIKRVRQYHYSLSPDLPHGYNHLDLDLDGNVFTSGDAVLGIIDFDDVLYSPAIVCLGYSLWNILDTDGEEVMRTYLDAYEKVRPLTPLEREALPHIISFRNYMIGAVRLLLREDDAPMMCIENLLKIEKNIPHFLTSSVR